MSDIKALRAGTGLSQKDFAEKYGLSLRSVQAWECGYRRCPERTMGMLLRIIRLESGGEARDATQD